MAVIETLQGVEVSINVDGVPLDEHIDRGVPTKSRSVECYVEAKTDAHFTVNVKTSDSTKFIGDCIIFAVTVDGIWAKSLILSKEQHSKGWHRNLAFEGTHVDCDSLRPFCFAPLKIASDQSISKDEAIRAKDVGSIVVTVTNARVLSKTNIPVFRKLAEHAHTYSEKALKGRSLSHDIRFADPISARSPPMWKTVPVQGDSLAGTFRFHYCSRGALQSMLIIPRTPSPPPLEARDPTSLSLAEIQEMQQRLQTQTSTINKIKRERDDVREHCSPRKVARRSGRLLVQGSEGDGDVVQVTRTQ